MKKISVIFVVVFGLSISTPLPAFDLYYYTHGIQQQLSVNDTLVTVSFQNESRLDVANFALSSPVLEDDFAPYPIDPKFWCFRIESGISSVQALESLSSNPEVAQVNPAFISQEHITAFLNDEIILRFDEGVRPQVVDSILVANGLEVDTAAICPTGTMVCRLSSSIPAEIIDVANRFFENAPVVFCHPNFACEVILDAIPNDEFFDYQWNCLNVGQMLGKVDADIDANEAWNITQGDPEVVVAVLDDGFQYVSGWQHADIDYSRVLQGIDFGGDHPKYLYPVDYDPSPCYYETHGIACAGLIFSRQNNAEGMAGLAPLVSFLPVKILGGNGQSDICGMPELAFPSRISRAIEWTADQGADIVSASWHTIPSDAITEQIVFAYNWNGVSFFFSAGNNGLTSHPDISYPAYLPYVMAIGASDQWDRKWNYSSFGDSIDVVAPSGGPGGGYLFTLDGIGPTGFVPTPNQCAPETQYNYNCAFTGTSGACPQVAGIAALILSVRPDLRNGHQHQIEELYQLIKSSAEDHLGDAMDLPGWDRYYGWGRVNAKAALDSALASAPTCTWKVSDADGNSIYTISDAVYLITYIFGGGPAPTPHPRGSGDADCNRIVTISDAVYLITYIFGGGPAPALTCDCRDFN